MVGDPEPVTSRDVLRAEGALRRMYLRQCERSGDQLSCEVSKVVRCAAAFIAMTTQGLPAG